MLLLFLLLLLLLKGLVIHRLLIMVLLVLLVAVVVLLVLLLLLRGEERLLHPHPTQAPSGRGEGGLRIALGFFATPQPLAATRAPPFLCAVRVRGWV